MFAERVLNWPLLWWCSLKIDNGNRKGVFKGSYIQACAVALGRPLARNNRLSPWLGCTLLICLISESMLDCQLFAGSDNSLSLQTSKMRRYSSKLFTAMLNSPEIFKIYCQKLLVLNELFAKIRYTTSSTSWQNVRGTLCELQNHSRPFYFPDLFQQNYLATNNFIAHAASRFHSVHLYYKTVQPRIT